MPKQFEDERNMRLAILANVSRTPTQMTQSTAEFAFVLLIILCLHPLAMSFTVVVIAFRLVLTMHEYH